MKSPRSAIAMLLAALALPGTALAELAFNVGAVSDYRYRGISQTRLKPAVQGGVDWSVGGLYVGAWASTIKWIKDAGGDADVEVDVYGGYKGDIGAGFGYDVGLLTYQYPSNKLNPKAETTELYGAVTWGPVTAKYSHSVSNLFGFADSKNSKYFDLSASFDLGRGLTLAPHLGRQLVSNNGAASYTDASLALNWDAGKGLVLSATAVDARTSAYVGPGNKDLGKRALVLGAKYNF